MPKNGKSYELDFIPPETDTIMLRESGLVKKTIYASCLSHANGKVSLAGIVDNLNEEQIDLIRKVSINF